MLYWSLFTWTQIQFNFLLGRQCVSGTTLAPEEVFSGKSTIPFNPLCANVQLCPAHSCAPVGHKTYLCFQAGLPLSPRQQCHHGKSKSLDQVFACVTMYMIITLCQWVPFRFLSFSGFGSSLSFFPYPQVSSISWSSISSLTIHFKNHPFFCLRCFCLPLSTPLFTKCHREVVTNKIWHETIRQLTITIAGTTSFPLLWKLGPRTSGSGMTSENFSQSKNIHKRGLCHDIWLLSLHCCQRLRIY